MQESDKENNPRLQFLNSHALALLYDGRENILFDFSTLLWVHFSFSARNRNMEMPLAKSACDFKENFTACATPIILISEGFCNSSSWSQKAFV